MEQQNDRDSNGFNRREFIQNTTSFGALMMLMGGVPLYAQETNAPTSETHYSTASPPVNFAVIGCGVWGREILRILSLLPNAPVVAICDNYEAAMRRVKESAPQAEAFADYHKLLEKKEVEAVIVATPSHLHREIVEAALAAGKHVYCEAPIASTVEDAQAIAKAAKAAVKVNFQSGLQMRSDPQRNFIVPFIRSGALGKHLFARSQWHKKESWRRTAPTPEREKVLNWRLNAATSPGLVGEIGIHQLDLVMWMLNQKPRAVTGWGRTLAWNENDDRDVADTVQAVFEFPDGANYFSEYTLGNSFDLGYEMLYGTNSAVMMRVDAVDGSKAWLFEEVDSPLFGWEVYARKEQFYKETGIALVADASKLQKQAKAGQPPPPAKTSLQSAFEAFITNCGLVASELKSYASKFDYDADEFRQILDKLKQTKSWQPAASWQEGFEATALALKANAAVMKGKGNRIEIEKSLFEV
jgi:predicted dehydrogenase